MPTFSEADPIVILSYARTPMGGMQGALSDRPLRCRQTRLILIEMSRKKHGLRRRREGSG